MNKIEVKSNTKEENITLTEDTIIFYNDCDCKVNYKVENDIKIFECLINSKIISNYNIKNNLILNIFSVDTTLNITLDINKEDLNINYIYSTLNNNDNKYEINVNHNCKNGNSKIINHGINIKNNKLDFLINVKVLKQSKNIVTNQDSKIISLDKNNCAIKPNLLIDNYDAYASHSAYIGDFKKNDLFYLTSRGITLESSRKLLAKSFLIGNMDISFREINIILDKLNAYWR